MLVNVVWVVLLLSLMGAASVRTSTVFPLDGQWQIQNGNKSISLTGSVPGCVHTALLQSKIIPEPFYRCGDLDLQWVAFDNWTYTRTFNLPSNYLKATKIALVCEGIDTVSSISVNGHVIGQTDNMFRRYVFDVSSLLSFNNNISVALTSAVGYAKAQHDKYPFVTTAQIPPNCPAEVQRGFCHPNFIRKEQSSFSWDWGPAFAPQGIWQSIHLEAYDTAVIRDITTVSSPRSSDSWTLDVDVFLDVGTKFDGVVVASIFETGDVAKVGVSLSPGENKINLQLICQDVNPWMPSGYGDPNLYTLEVKFYTQSGSFELQSKAIRIGFRTIELIQEPIGNKGKSFYFKINGVPIFIKGANWIPTDAFEDRVTTDTLKNLLTSAKEANMNLLRVWGGGIYQPDSFYTLADELGILIWEEFMFACAMYPTDDAFLSNVAEEIKHQVRRLKYHPSLIVWGGNNENEAAVAQNWYGTNVNRTYYVDLYKKLYFDIVQQTLFSIDQSRPFVSSSPSNGYENSSFPVADNPQDEYFGDVHYYNYGADCWDVGVFPRPRFASEYGYESFPSFLTLQNYSTSEDWYYNSTFMDHRQHHGDGNKQIQAQILKHFSLPPSGEQVRVFTNTLRLTQIYQAMCMKTETEHYRRIKNEIISDGRGNTMGTIYWQLNDIWPGASWSSLEYGGRWKFLHYFAKNFYSTVLVSAYSTKGTVGAYLVSDLSTPIKNATLSIDIWKWGNQLSPAKTFTQPVSSAPFTSAPVFQKDLSSLLQSGGCAQASDCFLLLKVNSLDQKLLSKNFLFLGSLNSANGMTPPQIQISDVSKVGPNTFIVTLKTQAVAGFVWLETKLPGTFSDNGFILTDQLTDIMFVGWGDEDISASDFSASLTVTSYFDMVN